MALGYGGARQTFMGRGLGIQSLPVPSALWGAHTCHSTHATRTCRTCIRTIARTCAHTCSPRSLARGNPRLFPQSHWPLQAPYQTLVPAGCGDLGGGLCWALLFSSGLRAAAQRTLPDRHPPSVQATATARAPPSTGCSPGKFPSLYTACGWPQTYVSNSAT